MAERRRDRRGLISALPRTYQQHCPADGYYPSDTYLRFLAAEDIAAKSSMSGHSPATLWLFSDVIIPPLLESTSLTSSLTGVRDYHEQGSARLSVARRENLLDSGVICNAVIAEDALHNFPRQLLPLMLGHLACLADQGFNVRFLPSCFRIPRYLDCVDLQLLASDIGGPEYSLYLRDIVCDESKEPPAWRTEGEDVFWSEPDDTAVPMSEYASMQETLFALAHEQPPDLDNWL